MNTIKKIKVKLIKFHSLKTIAVNRSMSKLREYHVKLSNLSVIELAIREQHQLINQPTPRAELCFPGQV